MATSDPLPSWNSWSPLHTPSATHIWTTARSTEHIPSRHLNGILVLNNTGLHLSKSCFIAFLRPEFLLSLPVRCISCSCLLHWIRNKHVSNIPSDCSLLLPLFRSVFLSPFAALLRSFILLLLSPDLPSALPPFWLPVPFSYSPPLPPDFVLNPFPLTSFYMVNRLT